MMRLVALAATLALTLTACGGGGEPGGAATNSQTASGSPTASPATIYKIPDVTGALFRDGVSELDNFGIPLITLGDAERIAEGIGVDSISDAADLEVSSDDTDQQELEDYVIYKTEPAAGSTHEVIDTITVFIKAVLPPEAMGKTWVAECRNSPDAAFTRVYSLKDALALFKKDSDVRCYFEVVSGETFVPSKDEKKAMSIAWEDTESKWADDTELFIKMQELCVDSTTWSYSDIDPALYKAASMICPTSPSFKDLDAWGNGKKFMDGTYVVGEDIVPGTYKTTEVARDCYWERSSANGETIANDFVTFAAKGAIATIRKGESFVSEDCGTWEKQ